MNSIVNSNICQKIVFWERQPKDRGTPELLCQDTNTIHNKTVMKESLKHHNDKNDNHNSPTHSDANKTQKQYKLNNIRCLNS